MRDELTPYLLLLDPAAINLADLNISNMMAGIAPQRKQTKKGNNIWWGSWTGEDHDEFAFQKKHQFL